MTSLFISEEKFLTKVTYLKPVQTGTIPQFKHTFVQWKPIAISGHGHTDTSHEQ